ncbi:Inner membrane protein yccS [Serratia rubidaea]|uniref:Inner membrane protein yccS n=1 Tax=Serratia rubidaea TaxID=61652 RepID=A0A3S4JUW8_SERRU|nr:Inner membrane protein yccS [Serratia rubidaea]
MFNVLNDAVCYVDGALQHDAADAQRINQALEKLSARIAQLTPEPESKEQLVLQQIGLVVELLPELTSLNAQIGQSQ